MDVTYSRHDTDLNIDGAQHGADPEGLCAYGVNKNGTGACHKAVSLLLAQQAFPFPGRSMRDKGGFWNPGLRLYNATLVRLYEYCYYYGVILLSCAVRVALDTATGMARTCLSLGTG